MLKKCSTGAGIPEISTARDHTVHWAPNKVAPEMKQQRTRGPNEGVNKKILSWVLIQKVTSGGVSQQKANCHRRISRAAECIFINYSHDARH
jgi:hypothetical protein